MSETDVGIELNSARASSHSSPDPHPARRRGLRPLAVGRRRPPRAAPVVDHVLVSNPICPAVIRVVGHLSIPFVCRSQSYR